MTYISAAMLVRFKRSLANCSGSISDAQGDLCRLSFLLLLSLLGAESVPADRLLVLWCRLSPASATRSIGSLPRLVPVLELAALRRLLERALRLMSSFERSFEDDDDDDDDDVDDLRVRSFFGDASGVDVVVVSDKMGSLVAEFEGASCSVTLGELSRSTSSCSASASASASVRTGVRDEVTRTTMPGAAIGIAGATSSLLVGTIALDVGVVWTDEIADACWSPFSALEEAAGGEIEEIEAVVAVPSSVVGGGGCCSVGWLLLDFLDLDDLLRDSFNICRLDLRRSAYLASFWRAFSSRCSRSTRRDASESAATTLKTSDISRTRKDLEHLLIEQRRALELVCLWCLNAVVLDRGVIDILRARNREVHGGSVGHLLDDAIGPVKRTQHIQEIGLGTKEVANLTCGRGESAWAGW